ncbi:MAG: hypothetical protein D6718_10940 [Acidobacteria bacterium]|nr:MAG: hypothetical protein D6718_10940 [Acidobacteriota bacterium]
MSGTSAASSIAPPEARARRSSSGGGRRPTIEKRQPSVRRRGKTSRTNHSTASWFGRQSSEPVKTRSRPAGGGP